MKKTVAALLFILLLTLLVPQTVFAAKTEPVTDTVGLLTSEQERELNQRARDIALQYGCEVAVFVVDKMNYDDAYESAKYIYREYDLGYGDAKSGVLLFLSMAERDYAVIAYGSGNTAFTDHAKDVLIDKHILPPLRQNDYYRAFAAYLDTAEEYLAMAKDGAPFDVGTDKEYRAENARKALPYKLAITVLAPLLIAWLFCSRWKRQMKTAVEAREADKYIPEGGFVLSVKEDLFLYMTETRSKIESSSSSSSGGTTKDKDGFSGKSGKF